MIGRLRSFVVLISAVVAGLAVGTPAPTLGDVAVPRSQQPAQPVGRLCDQGIVPEDSSSATAVVLDQSHLLVPWSRGPAVWTAEPTPLRPPNKRRKDLDWGRSCQGWFAEVRDAFRQAEHPELARGTLRMGVSAGGYLVVSYQVKTKAGLYLVEVTDLLPDRPTDREWTVCTENGPQPEYILIKEPGEQKILQREYGGHAVRLERPDDDSYRRSDFRSSFEPVINMCVRDSSHMQQ